MRRRVRWERKGGLGEGGAYVEGSGCGKGGGDEEQEEGDGEEDVHWRS